MRHGKVACQRIFPAWRCTACVAAADVQLGGANHAKSAPVQTGTMETHHGTMRRCGHGSRKDTDLVW